MGGRRKKARNVHNHSNKYQKYSKAEKLMEKQINEEIYKLPEHELITEEPVVEEILEDEYEEKIINMDIEEFEVPYYKDIKPYSGEVRRGEIYFFDKGPKVGVEQQGGRPGIIVSNNLCNKHSEFVEVVYTTCQPKTELPTHITINSTPKPCIALCEQVHTLSKKKIRCYYGEITAEEECEINRALKINLALTDNIDADGERDWKKDFEAVVIQYDKISQTLHESQKEVERLTEQLNNKCDSNSSNEDTIYKTLYHELLDKVLKLKLQEEK